MQVDKPYVCSLLRRLVQHNSVNAAEGGPGESAILRSLEQEIRHVAPQIDITLQANVLVARLKGSNPTGKTLMLNGHVDTVGTDGYTGDAFAGDIQDGRLYGRGALDMKAGLAAILAAVKVLIGAGVRLRGDLVLAFVADEEDKSRGTRDLLELLKPPYRPDGAIVAEPTGLRAVVAHRGFAWLKLTTTGRAAHGSLPRDGRDANTMMAQVLAELARREEQWQATTPPHPLLGAFSLHVSELHGGSGPSTYAGKCEATVEWRSVPGQSEADMVQALEAVVASASAKYPGEIDAGVAVALFRPPLQAAPNAAVVRCVQRALDAGQTLEPTAAPFWTDAALLADAGIESVVLGPSGDGMHATEEWVDLASVYCLTRVFARVAVDFCGREENSK